MSQRPTPRTAENSTPSELWGASIRLFVGLVLLLLLIVPTIRDLPLGQTTRTAILAWLLVALSLYWLVTGQGYRPLLILQLLAFCTAVVLLTTKIGLVVIGIARLSILRRFGKGLIVVGAASAAINLVLMLVALSRRFRVTFSTTE